MISQCGSRIWVHPVCCASYPKFLLKQIQSPPVPHLSTNNGLMISQHSSMVRIQDFRSSFNIQCFTQTAFGAPCFPIIWKTFAEEQRSHRAPSANWFRFEHFLGSFHIGFSDWSFSQTWRKFESSTKQFIKILFEKPILNPDRITCTQYHSAKPDTIYNHFIICLRNFFLILPTLPVCLTFCRTLFLVDCGAHWERHGYSPPQRDIL